MEKSFITYNKKDNTYKIRKSYIKSLQDYNELNKLIKINICPIIKSILNKYKDYDYHKSYEYSEAYLDNIISINLYDKQNIIRLSNNINIFCNLELEQEDKNKLSSLSNILNYLYYC